MKVKYDKAIELEAEATFEHFKFLFQVLQSTGHTGKVSIKVVTGVIDNPRRETELLLHSGSQEEHGQKP